MSKSLRVLAILATSVVLLGSAPFAAAKGPERVVIDLDDPAIDEEESAALSEECEFPVAADNSGHIVLVTFPEGRKRMQAINHYNIRATYTNVETGAVARLHDAGPDRIYLKNGTLYVALTGRATTGSGVIGQTVINIETGEIVKQVGNDVGLFQDQLCAALAG